MLTIKKVIYNPPATIVLWNDGTKTMAKCDDEDSYNKETGFMLCVMKKKYGNKTVKRMFERYVYNTPEANHKGATVIEEKPRFRKPNITQRKVKVNRPTFYLSWVDDDDWNEWEKTILRWL